MYFPVVNNWPSSDEKASKNFMTWANYKIDIGEYRDRSDISSRHIELIIICKITL